MHTKCLFANPKGKRLLRRPQQKWQNKEAHTVMNLWGALPWRIFCTDQLSSYHLLKKNSGARNCCMKFISY